MTQANADAREGRILIVDDNSTNLKVLLQVLETAGYSVLAATSGARALTIAAQGAPDLILLDVRMPGMDGYEVCRRLKQDVATQGIPVIFITANDQTDAVVAGFHAGGVDYIPKPFRQEEVLARVEAHLSLRHLTRELEEKNATLGEANRELKETHGRLDQAQRQLIQELEDELQAAHDLQMGLMPRSSPQLEGLEIAGRCVPANTVGGDLFQYFEGDGRVSVVMADVTGHAMEAAIPMVMFSGILDTQMETPRPLEELFTSLNRSLCRVLPEHTFVCLAIAELSTSDGSFRLANSGCPYPLQYQAATAQVKEWALDAYPLGARADTVYEVSEGKLEPGDWLVFCSDGFAEAVDADGGMFSFERTAGIITQGCRDGVSPLELMEGLFSQVQSFAGSAAQSDDQTMVTIRAESSCRPC